MRILAPLVLGLLSTSLYAEVIDEGPSHPRVVAQMLVGTAGFEPGIGAEWGWHQGDIAFITKPEVFVNEDGRVGGGITLGWNSGWHPFNDRHDLTVGPRVVFHNSDDHGWEVSATAIYSVPITNALPDRHYIQIIGAAGIIQDKRDDKKTAFGGTIGAAYAYRF